MPFVIGVLYCDSLLQELLETSYNSTRVYLTQDSGESIVMETTESPIHLMELTPATLYHVELEFLFAGGHVGPRTRRSITTMDGSKATVSVCACVCE